MNIEDIGQVTAYLQNLQDKYHPNTYRKIYFQIRRFLQSQNLTYLDKVKLPRIIHSQVKQVTGQDVKQAIAHFSNSRNYLRYRAFIELAYASGLRPSELVQLTPAEIDLENRIVYVRNDLQFHTKTNKARVSFFDKRTQSILRLYLKKNKHRKLWNASSIARSWKGIAIHPKDLRKGFSQRASDLNLNSEYKARIMGHALNGVDNQHYLGEVSIEKLHKAYDDAFGGK